MNYEFWQICPRMFSRCESVGFVDRWQPLIAWSGNNALGAIQRSLSQMRKVRSTLPAQHFTPPVCHQGSTQIILTLLAKEQAKEHQLRGTWPSNQVPPIATIFAGMNKACNGWGGEDFREASHALRSICLCLGAANWRKWSLNLLGA